MGSFAVMEIRDVTDLKRGFLVRLSAIPVEKSIRKLCPTDNVFDGTNVHSGSAVSRDSASQGSGRFFSVFIAVQKTFVMTTYCNDTEMT